ncbi:hypothetical protein KY290_007994 [Solanum tuberosum]|uniref:RNase H type-1 domain-containing protein n=1 Tax=Solanum tuberosum TaxID=4113 RepID=A0ABQ7W777_SOLTU|nr:hypothetical protein KY290_007994 [Solanum tuberosum]
MPRRGEFKSDSNGASKGKRIGMDNNLVAEVVALRMVSPEVRRIQELVKGMEVVVEHTLREGNRLADFLANLQVLRQSRLILFKIYPERRRH